MKVLLDHDAQHRRARCGGDHGVLESEPFELQVTSKGSRWKGGRLLDLNGSHVSNWALQW